MSDKSMINLQFKFDFKELFSKLGTKQLMMKGENYTKILGKNIKDERTKKGLTIKELSRLTDVEELELIKIEKGPSRFELTTIIKIANALEVDVNYLFEH